MDLNAFGAILLLSVCGLRFADVDCAPSWLSTEYNGKNVYALKDSSITFDWRFSDGGLTRVFSQWLFLKPRASDPSIDDTIAIASGNNAQVASLYSSRVTFTSGSGQAGFQLRGLQAADKGKYKCTLTFSNNNILADYANLVVIVKPSITTKTPNVALEEGQSATLQCGATGSPTPRIRWYRNDVLVQDNPLKSNYEITNAGRSDKGTYKCIATVKVDIYEFHDQYSLSVTVRYKPEVTFLTRNQSLTEGTSSTELYCTADGVPVVTNYYYYLGKGTGSRIYPSSKFQLSDSNRRLRINNLQKNDANWYTCAAENSLGLGKGTSTYLRILYGPKTVSISFSPSNTINTYGSVTLTCQSDGEPQPSYSWKFNGQDIIGTGERGKNVIRTQLSKELAGNYTCIANNAYGRTEKTEILYVRYKPTVATLSTGTPRNGVVLYSRATLTCKADGYPPPDYVIKKDNVKVNQGTSAEYVISRVEYTDETARYSCTSSNQMGQGPTVTAVIEVQVKPNLITTLPTVKLIRIENTTLNYTCTADGKPAPEIIWTINGENVTRDKPYLGIVGESGSLNPQQPKLIRVESRLAFIRLSWRQYGNISCIARNDAGSVQQTTELEVKHCPVVKYPEDHPKNITLSNGGTATFSCKTIGNPPTKYYRWRFNGVYITGVRTSTYTKTNVGELDAGRYSCSGVSNLCEGPPFDAYLLIKTDSKITYYPDVTANETNTAILICRVSGVPTPVVTWTKEGDTRVLHTGQEYPIGNVTYEHGGLYICKASNELAVVSKMPKLIVQVVPVITTDKPTDTQIPGEIGKDASIRCTARAVPRAEYWWTRGTDQTKLTGGSDRVISINDEGSSKKIVVRVAMFGEKYHCHAKNMMGKDYQQFTIRKKGPPDAPTNVKVVGIQVGAKRTVDVNITWLAGYSGGYPQVFTILYKLTSVQEFTKIVLDNSAGSHYRLQGLKPRTVYEFMVRSQNIRGLSLDSEKKYLTTPVSSVPPARGTISVSRDPDDGTKVLITWTSNENVTAIYIEYRVKDNRARRADGNWLKVEGAQGLPRNVTAFTVVNLKEDKIYQFRILFKYAGETGSSESMAVESDPVGPLPTVSKRTGLSTDELIAIIAASGGVLLILIVILCLCCFKKRKKPYGDSVEMSQTASGPSPYPSYAAGGPDITRLSNDGRRSYATESIEDDPFIEAHLASLTVMDGKKKKKPDPSVNFGYASQDSIRQEEMLLNPGSRAGVRGMSQSVGQLDSTDYPARGPQPDFDPLPPYHEPPSFEEAVRQSGRKAKSKNRSTGDLTDRRRNIYGMPQSQIPQSPDDPTDSSDAERKYRPTFKVRPEPDEDPGYSSVDILNGPRRPAPLAPRDGAARNGPIDPTVPYARPQKKSTPRNRPPGPPERTNPERGYGEYAMDDFRASPTSWGYPEYYNEWPPPQYTAEDRTSIPGLEDDFEPRVNRRHPVSSGVLELDDSTRHHGNDRLPDLPPRMADFSNSRGLKNSKELVGESPQLPEPPSFLRDVVYSDDDEYEPPPARSWTEPRQPTRSRQPYVNIHGQLVRPGSQDSDLNRNEGIRLSSSTLEPEPEPPHHQRGRVPSGGDGDHEVGYVSSGFLV